MDGTRRLPLFPLSTVLFPGLQLPLQVFEDRYRLLVKRCLEGDRALGIVLIRNGREIGETAKPHPVGTLGRLLRVEKRSDGKIGVVIVGERRFRIVGLVETEPYLVGEVELLPDHQPVDRDRLVASIRLQYTNYLQTLRRLTNNRPSETPVPKDALELSYLVAANLHVSRVEQQALLEVSTDQRLSSLHATLRREIALLDNLGAVVSRRPFPAENVSLN